MVKISDEELVRLLMENARMPINKIAKALGVSDTAVRKRIRKLEEEGVIRKYTVEVDPKKLGFGVVAIIGVDAMPEKLIHVIETLKERNEVIHLYTASGDHMLLMECWLRNSEELSRFVKYLESLEGVTRVCPAIVLEKVK